MTANKNASAKLRRRREWWAQQLQRRAQLADTHCARCQAPEPAEDDPLVPATPGSALRVVSWNMTGTQTKEPDHTTVAGLLSVSVREGQRWLVVASRHTLAVVRSADAVAHLGT